MPDDFRLEISVARGRKRKLVSHSQGKPGQQVFRKTSSIPGAPRQNGACLFKVTWERWRGAKLQ